MKISIKQISDATGFSPATVSNALNNKRGVNQATAETIKRVATELGYFQSTTITRLRFLLLKRNGLIIDNSPFFPAVIEGVERQAKEMGVETILTNLQLDDRSFPLRLRDMLHETGTAVMVLATELMEEDYNYFTEAQCPLIFLDSSSDVHHFDFVQINNEDAVAEACQYLLCKGHREIGYLRASFRIKAFVQRASSLNRSLKRAGLKLDPKHVVTVSTTTEGAYRDMLAHLEKRPPLPTAFLADDDVIALGAMRALQESGYRVPEDVSIVGFDDVPFGEISSPRLTTIHVYKQQLGEIAVRRLFDPPTTSGEIRTKILVYTDFVERESVKDLSKRNE